MVELGAIDMCKPFFQSKKRGLEKAVAHRCTQNCQSEGAWNLQPVRRAEYRMKNGFGNSERQAVKNVQTIAYPAQMHQWARNKGGNARKVYSDTCEQQEYRSESCCRVRQKANRSSAGTECTTECDSQNAKQHQKSAGRRPQNDNSAFQSKANQGSGCYWIQPRHGIAEYRISRCSKVNESGARNKRHRDQGPCDFRQMMQPASHHLRPRQIELLFNGNRPKNTHVT